MVRGPEPGHWGEGEEGEEDEEEVEGGGVVEAEGVVGYAENVEAERAPSFEELASFALLRSARAAMLFRSSCSRARDRWNVGQRSRQYRSHG